MAVRSQRALREAQSDDDERFDHERLTVLVRYSAALRWQMSSIAVVMASIAWAGGNAPGVVALWLATTLTVRELRAAALLRLAHADPRPIGLRLQVTEPWTLALGSAYGASALFTAGMDTAYGAILTMILVSLSAGAVSTTFTVTRAFIAFAAGISAPLVLVWLFAGDWLGGAVAALILMFFGVQLRFSRQNLQMFTDSFRMRLENAELLRQLSDERALLENARDAAVAADLAKSRFLAAASHDLRQPLQSLSLNSGALARLPMPEPTREVASEVSSGIEALRTMLDALLDVSQLEAGALTPEPRAIPVERLLQGLANQWRPAAQAKGLTLHCDVGPGLVVISDAQMLQRVLSNLLDNAVKFTAEGRVGLHAQAVGDEVRISVDDTGCGIDAQSHERVFDDLVQLGNPQRDRLRGHGLGLGIARRLCRLLGIRLALESAPGVGSRFHLHLPSASASAAAVSDRADVEPRLAARRVLVLDDDASVRTAYAHALRTLDCEAVGTATLAEALDTLAWFDAEIAVVDFRLAGPEDGLAAVARLRALRPGLPAVIVSADTSAQLRQRAAEQGLTMLRKPVTDVLLARTINDLVVGRTAHEADADVDRPQRSA